MVKIVPHSQHSDKAKWTYLSIQFLFGVTGHYSNAYQLSEQIQFPLTYCWPTPHCTSISLMNLYHKHGMVMNQGTFSTEQILLYVREEVLTTKR